MEEKRVICIGDIHGHLDKLESLWENLRESLGDEKLDKSVIVFLGDMCDRGPQTKGVLEWILNLKQEREEKKKGSQEKQIEGGKREWKEGEVVVLAGNHDFGFSTYVASCPFSPVLEEEIEKTGKSKVAAFTKGFYRHQVAGGMHYTGRRWGGSYVYNARQTFQSYGCDFQFTEEARDNLIAKIPPSHHELLKNLDWVYDIEVPWGQKRLICVHAGLPNLKKGHMEEYLQAMAQRDVLNNDLQVQEFGRFPFFSGRGDVVCPPECLVREAVVVSGHHGTRRTEEGRVIIDTSGGSPGIPLEAIVFPECQIVCSGANSPIEGVSGIFG